MQNYIFISEACFRTEKQSCRLTSPHPLMKNDTTRKRFYLKSPKKLTAICKLFLLY